MGRGGRCILVGAAAGLLVLGGWWLWSARSVLPMATVPTPGEACQPAKITFDLDAVGADDLTGPPNGQTVVDYEFCIPYADETLSEVMAIDPHVVCIHGPSGRIGCTDREYLCIGDTARPDFRRVLCRLSLLDYVNRIDQTFWE